MKTLYQGKCLDIVHLQIILNIALIDLILEYVAYVKLSLCFDRFKMNLTFIVLIIFRKAPLTSQ